LSSCRQQDLKVRPFERSDGSKTSQFGIEHIRDDIFIQDRVGESMCVPLHTCRKENEGKIRERERGERREREGEGEAEREREKEGERE
jgi:hypothetical protein